MYESSLNKLPFQEAMGAATANTNRLQFFSSLFDVNDVVFLDPNRVYCILKTDRYNGMRSEL
jgi:hypothetical protein